ncbi:MAG: TadE/TadG family type IV pilus assembly protein [Hyphomicrobiales bacterium]
MNRASSSLMRHVRDLARDKAGNTAVMFGLAIIPLLVVVGMAVDYARVTSVRDKLDNAADVAALASVSKSANPFVTPPTQASVRKYFDAIANTIPGVTITSFQATIVPSVTNMSVAVSYTGQVQTTLARIIGISTIAIGGTATAKVNAPPYIDFYLLLDNSPSMGLGATAADISHLQSLTPDSCAFACHQHTFDSKGNVTGDDLNDYYHVAKNNGVTVRIDVLRTATQQLTQTATSTATVQNQFRMGVYEFNDSLTTISDLSSNLSAVSSAANAIDLAYAYYDQRDSQTSYDVALPGINAIMTNPGNGLTPSTPRKFLFFVTDGVQDEPVANLPPPQPSGNVNSNRLINTLNPSLCTTIKNRGIQIAILYTPYLPVTNNAFYNQWVAPISSQIPTNLQSCASPGFYFQITPTQGISEAMQAMFTAAVSSVLLTN